MAATEKPQSMHFVLTAPTGPCRWLSRTLKLHQTGFWLKPCGALSLSYRMLDGF